MVRDAVQFTTAHLERLCAQNMRAATELDSAADLVCEVDRRIRSSHGVIANPTATAIEAVRYARRTATESLAGRAQELSETLSTAARRYADTDLQSAEDLDHQLRPH